MEFKLYESVFYTLYFTGSENKAPLIFHRTQACVWAVQLETIIRKYMYYLVIRFTVDFPINIIKCLTNQLIP